MFCKNCGKELVGSPEYCTNCGARISELPAAGTGANPKSKVASILLAVFLSFWTWLYTYKRDGWKFWVGVGLWIFYIILAIATLGAAMVFLWIIFLGVWIWAIVDTAIKNDDWYRYYD
jgi:hypothetical protein